MTTQPEPLRLAESISQMDTFTEHQRGEILKAAAELRRLYALNQELLVALKELLQDTQHFEHECGDSKWCPVLKARAAIARAEGRS